MAKCIGTYPKWLAYVMRWFMRKQKGYNVELWFRGRGGRKGSISYRQSLPLKYASKVAIYIK